MKDQWSQDLNNGITLATLKSAVIHPIFTVNVKSYIYGVRTSLINGALIYHLSLNQQAVP